MVDGNTAMPETIFETMEFKVTGKAMDGDDGYDLSSVVQSLSSFENLIIKTYLQANGKQRFTVVDKSNIEIKLKNVKKGSLISEIGVLYSTVILPAAPILIENGQFIFDTIKTSYEFLKTKISNTKEGKTVEINQTVDNQGIAVSNTGSGTVTINVHPIVASYAEALAPAFQKMAENIDGKDIDSISLVSDEIEEEENRDVAFSMTPEDKSLFQGRTVITEELISISGKIVDGNFKNQNGQIEVTACADERIEVGETYSFSVDERLNAEEVWKEMFLEDKPYFCSLRLYYNPVGGEEPYKISEIVIRDWDNRMWDEE